MSKNNQNIANSVLLQKPDHSAHNLSCETKTTTTMGRLTPVFMQEVVPGDRIEVDSQMLTKLLPLATPVMHNMNAYIHYFYVPYRILWNNWKYFVSDSPLPQTSTPPLHPKIKFTGGYPEWFNHDNADDKYLPRYFGLQNPDIGYINPLPLLAYQKIYNEYYRHEKIHTDLTPDLVCPDGEINETDPKVEKWVTLRYRTYKDDYFTSALPSPQLGDQATVSLNITDNELNVYRNRTGTTGTATERENWVSGYTGNNTTGDITRVLNKEADAGILNQYLYVDASQLSGSIAINDLIEMVRMQEFLVRKNLSGNRYNEYILAMFGVRVPDLRIDRPDYIAGIKAPIVVSEVLNTAEAQGYQTGQANGYSEGGSGNYEVSEHGIILGIYSCIPDSAYMSSVNKLFYKTKNEEYYTPVFDQMGEQPILNKELHQNHATPNSTFGYVPRYAEYRLPFNLVTGNFTNTLAQWSLARSYNDTINLSARFFDIYSPSRIFGIEDPNYDNVIVQVYNRVIAYRPMSKYSMPVLTNNYSNNLV
jgi:hypothetical protein